CRHREFKQNPGRSESRGLERPWRTRPAHLGGPLQGDSKFPSEWRHTPRFIDCGIIESPALDLVRSRSAPQGLGVEVEAPGLERDGVERARAPARRGE